jgi:serine/threonine protein kinase
VRCLLCYTEDLPPDTVKCPKCGQPFAVMLRDTLPAGYALDHGQYRIEYPVGRGGFGITYRATDAARGFPVAIKEFFVRDLMNRDGSTGGVTLSAEDKDRVDRVRQRFQREGRTLLRVQHPNVVRILDLFEQNDTAYLVMEYLAGQTLRSRMTEELTGPDGSTRWQSRRLPPEEARAIMGSLVAALAAVHEAKIFHLDLKPANILIEPDGRVVLIDFGAARQEVGTGQTVPSYTANYAPPEVMTGKKVGPESDIFEAGMLLYEMLTGALPPPASARMFDADHAASWQPSDIPEPWRGLVASALHLEQTRRPKDVRAWWHTAFPEVPAAERMAPPMAERVAPEVEMIDQTIRERVTHKRHARTG